MSKSLSPDEIRAAAEEARAEAKRIRRAADLEAMALELYADELDEAARRGLTIAKERVSIRHRMQVPSADASRPRRDVGRKPKLDTPFRKWLYETDQTVEEYAARKRKKPSTVKSWTIRGQKKGGRPILMVDALDVQNEAGKDEHGNWRVPATDEAWPNGINS